MQNEAYARWVLGQNIKGAGKKFLLLTLALLADDKGNVVVSQQQLAGLTGQSRGAIAKYLPELEKNGYITRVPRYYEDGGRAADLYVLPLPGDSPSPNEDGRGDAGDLLNTSMRVIRSHQQ